MTDVPRLVVDTSSPVPPYEQLRGQLADLIRHGALADGDRLPPVRQLAGDLGLAVGTAARAYRELERAGLVQSKRGAGTRVVAGVAPSSEVDRAALVAAWAAEYLAHGRRLGLSDEKLLDAVRDAAAAQP